MNRFLSNATNRIDAKGRVSVPSAFRAVLARDGIEELYGFQDFHYPAINIGGPELLARLERRLQDMDPFGAEANRMSLLIHGGGVHVKLDSEGRLMVTDFIRSYTGIEDEVAFVGRADFFQVWRPADFQDAQKAARQGLKV